MKPVRIQRSRQHKQESPNGLPIVYVGRPSEWGNPFKAVCVSKNWFVVDSYGIVYGTFKTKQLAMIGCFLLFKDMFYNLNSHPVPDEIYKQFRWMRDRHKDLSDKNISCWCKPGEPCHGDVLLEFVNNND